MSLKFIESNSLNIKLKFRHHLKNLNILIIFVLIDEAYNKMFYIRKKKTHLFTRKFFSFLVYFSFKKKNTKIFCILIWDGNDLLIFSCYYQLNTFR